MSEIALAAHDDDDVCWHMIFSLFSACVMIHLKSVDEYIRPEQGSMKAQYISLKGLLSKKGSQRINHLDKVQKVLMRLKRFGGRHLPLLGCMLVVDLLDLTAIDTQPTRWQDHLSHLVTQAPAKWCSGLWFQDKGQVEHLRHLKQTFCKAEAIGIHPGLHCRLRQEEAHGIMGQKQPIEFLPHSFGRLR